MENREYLFLGIILYFIADSIVLLMSKFIDMLTLIFAINIILNIFFKFIGYGIIAFLLFRFIKHSKKNVSKTLFIFIILTRFIPSVGLTSIYSSNELYYFNSIGKFLGYFFLLIVVAISYIKLYREESERN